MTMNELKYIIILSLVISCNFIEIATNNKATIDPDFFGNDNDRVSTTGFPTVFETQNFTTDFITVPQGLDTYSEIATNDVKKVYVDSNGVIYVATFGGLAISYDGGLSFKNFTTANGLGGNKVTDVKVDANGVIYASTYGGLGISNDGGNSFVNRTAADNGIVNINNQINALDIGNNKIYLATGSGVSVSTDLSGDTFSTLNVSMSRDIFVDNTNILVATSAGLLKSTDSGTNFSIFDNGSAPPISNNLWSVFKKDTFMITASSDSGLYVSQFDPVNFSQKNNVNDQLASDDVRDVFIDKNNTFYAATAQGLSHISDGDLNFTSLNNINNNLASDVTNSVFVDENLTLFVGTEDGLSVKYPTDNNFVNSKSFTGLPWNITKVFVDSNNVYAGSQSNGLFVSYDSGVSFSKVNGISGSQITTIFADDNGIYVGTDMGIAISRDSGLTFSNIAKGAGGGDALLNGAIKKVYVSSGKIYIATLVGLSVAQDLDATTFINITSPTITNDMLTSVFVEGDNIFLTSMGSGLDVSTDGGVNFSNLTNGLASTITYDVSKSNDGNVYVATNSGLSKLNNDGTTFSTLMTGLINSVKTDQFGNLFVAHNTIGLMISTDNGTSFSIYDTSSGLSQNVARSVSVDSEGNVFVATPGGLSRSTPLLNY